MVNSLLSKLNKDAVYIISTPASRRYITGFSSSAGTTVLHGDKAFFIIDGRYFEQAQADIKDFEVIQEISLFKQISVLLKDFNVKKIFTESAITCRRLSEFKDAFADYEVEPSDDLDKIVSLLRSVKQPFEVALIETAQRIAEDAFTHILEFIRPGVSEVDIALELETHMRRHGAKSAAFETIAIAGSNTSKPHGVPGDYAVSNSDFITMDFGAQYKGYHSDMTRTVAVGSISDDKQAIYETVLAAQLAAIAAAKPGVRCCDVDAAARNVIKTAGFGKEFCHSTGHGVGVEVHEAPAVSERNESPLVPGNTITVEPGIYLPGQFGVRIEDMLVITDDGHQNITRADKELIIL